VLSKIRKERRKGRMKIIWTGKEEDVPVVSVGGRGRWHDCDGVRRE
jgi:hypothetical protein